MSYVFVMLAGMFLGALAMDAAEWLGERAARKREIEHLEEIRRLIMENQERRRAAE